MEHDVCDMVKIIYIVDTARGCTKNNGLNGLSKQFKIEKVKIFDSEKLRLNFGVYLLINT